MEANQPQTSLLMVSFLPCQSYSPNNLKSRIALTHRVVGLTHQWLCWRPIAFFQPEMTHGITQQYSMRFKQHTNLSTIKPYTIPLDLTYTIDLPLLQGSSLYTLPLHRPFNSRLRYGCFHTSVHVFTTLPWQPTFHHHPCVVHSTSTYQLSSYCFTSSSEVESLSTIGYSDRQWSY